MIFGFLVKFLIILILVGKKIEPTMISGSNINNKKKKYLKIFLTFLKKVKFKFNKLIASNIDVVFMSKLYQVMSYHLCMNYYKKMIII